jgi:hypothetical protein
MSLLDRGLSLRGFFGLEQAEEALVSSTFVCDVYRDRILKVRVLNRRRRSWERGSLDSSNVSQIGTDKIVGCN